MTHPHTHTGGAARLDCVTLPDGTVQRVVVLSPDVPPPAPADGPRYRVHMYRWGDPAADHTYEAADCDSLAAAFARAADEVEGRGGKYGAVVWRQPPAEGGGWMKRHTGTWQVMATVAMKDVPREAT